MSHADDDYRDAEDHLDDEEHGEPSRVRRADDHHHLLHVFRDLTLHAGADRLDEIATEISEHLEGPWRRAKERDKNEFNGGTVDWRVFERLVGAERPGALLFLVPNRSEDNLYVSNIVPTRGQALSADSYNEILVEFTSRFARPACDALAIRCELTNDWVDLAAQLGQRAFKALVAAALFPNGTHPSDEERWIRFILTARKESLDINLTLLARWLEAEGFTPRRASDLVNEYDFALKLLDLYDRP